MQTDKKAQNMLTAAPLAAPGLSGSASSTPAVPLAFPVSSFPITPLPPPAAFSAFLAAAFSAFFLSSSSLFHSSSALFRSSSALFRSASALLRSSSALFFASASALFLQVVETHVQK